MIDDNRIAFRRGG